MSKKLKKGLIRIIICAAAFITVKLLEAFTSINDFKYVTLILYLTIYAGISYDIIKKACMNIIRGNMLDENFLMM
ncbi:MAG: heavy metal translocating P-type ATPase, partial [Lachnospiraceae bacterium]|nr:heavy metal translocating P-type ATPase [Lachnospiraceae bacterium]